MNCQEFIRYISDYIDRNLNEELTQEAEEHLATCHNCHLVLDTTRQTIHLSRAMQARQMSINNKNAVFERLKKALEDRQCPPES